MTVVEVAAERNILPIASSRATWRHVVKLFRQERAFFSLVIGLQIVASAAGLVGPRILEVVINDAGPTGGPRRSSSPCSCSLAALVVQTVLTGATRGWAPCWVSASSHGYAKGSSSQC